MRKFTVDFKTADIGTIGRKGEHNYPVMEFALDEDFQKCDFIIIEFGINGKKIPINSIKPIGETLTFKLTKQLTKAGHHHVQLVGYVVDAETAEPQEIMKSPVVHFHIEQSVSGTEQETDSNPSLLDIIISKIHKLMELAHFHRNKEILDAITEDSLKPESSPEIPLVYELPANPKTGDVCRLIRSEITAADGGRTVFFDYANLENLVKAGETHYNRVHYTININADEYSTWLRIAVDYSHDEIEITVEKFNSLYDSFEGDFDQWCTIFYLNDNGEWEFSTEENNAAFNPSYHYNRQTDTITYLLEPLASVNIPNEYISSVTVDKDIDINIFDINIFHLEPIIMLYDGEWRAVANESLLYKQNGATISKHETLEKTDGSKFFRLYLDWGKEVAPLTAKRWIDIPIEGTKESTEPGIIGTQSTGIQLQLGGTGNGKTIPIVTALPETAKEGDIVLYKPKGNTFTINDAGKTVYMEYSWIESYNGNGESFASQSMAECDSYGAAETGFYIEHLRGNPLYINYSAKDLVHNTLYGSLVWQYNAEENKYVFDSENSYGVDENGDTVYFTEPPQKFTLFYNFITEPTTTTVWDNVKLCPFTFFYIKPVLMHYQSGTWKELYYIPTKTSELENDSGFITLDDLPVIPEDIITGDKFTTQAENEEPVYGEELASADGWAVDGWSGDFTNGFTHATGNTNSLIFTIPEDTAQNTYRISFRCSESIAVESLMVRCGGSDLFDLYGQKADPVIIGIVSVENGNLEFVPSSTFKGTITDISIRRVTGFNPIIQTITDSTGEISYEMRATKSSLDNVFIGKHSGENNISGRGCSAVGSSALQNNTSGFWNVGIGHNALRDNTVGSRNIGIGYIALAENVTGIRNIAIGTYALNHNKTGNKNIAIGADALDHNVDGSFNVGIGLQVLYNNVNGNYNTAIGTMALTSATGNNNTAVGYSALGKCTTGNTNVALGYCAGNAITTGSNNFALGANALYKLKTGSNNIGIGVQAGRGQGTTAGFKQGIFIGMSTGYSLCNDADYNIFIGYESGHDVTTGKNNICIGEQTEPPTPTTSYWVNIGGLYEGSRNETDKYAKINGGLQLSNIPTSDPAIAGRVWNDNGVLKVSAG